MSSRNEILNNEVVRLEKLFSLKNESIVEVENKNRQLKDKVDKLETELLSWKLHASRADNSIVTENLEKSVILVTDKHSSTVNKQKTSKETSVVTDEQLKEDCITKQNPSRPSSSSTPSDSKQKEIHRDRSTVDNKERVLLIGTSNVHYLSSKYIAGDRYYVHKELKYTVSEARNYIESLTGKEKISKFLLHLSCNDIKSSTPESHASCYCDLVTFIHDKCPDAEVIVLLGLPRRDTTLNNKIEVANALIKKKLLNVQKTITCDNSNLAFRGAPAFGVLESDVIHLSGKGVFALNRNFRSCVYKTVGDSGPQRTQFGGRRRYTGYRRFSNDYDRSYS